MGGCENKSKENKYNEKLPWTAPYKDVKYITVLTKW